MKNLANKNIVITGAMGLIGKKISEVLAINKVNVIMLDIKNKKDIIKIKNYHYIKKYLNYLKCDVSNEKSLKKVSKIIFKRYKKIDVLINAAAITDAVERKNKDKEFIENHKLLTNGLLNLIQLFILINIIVLYYGKKILIKISG